MDAFVANLLPNVAHASIQSIVLAGLVFAICRAVPSLSAATRSWLWWLVAAQLILGIACPDLFTLRVLPASTTHQVTIVQGMALDMPVVAATDDTSHVSWQTVLLSAWAVAIVVQVAFALWRSRHLPGLLRRALPHDDARVEALCARRAHELGLRRSPRLAVSDEVSSPQVVGLWRPPPAGGGRAVPRRAGHGADARAGPCAPWRSLPGLDPRAGSHAVLFPSGRVAGQSRVRAVPRGGLRRHGRLPWTARTAELRTPDPAARRRSPSASRATRRVPHLPEPQEEARHARSYP